MAKKDRVPTPPKRPVQAPKAYKSEGSPRRTQWIFIGVAALILVVAAGIGIGFIMSSGGDSGDGGGINAAGCTFKTFDALEAGHVDKLPDGYEYNSIPATSGLHNPTTAIWNLYDQPVPEINYVHNLEHGGIVIWYGSKVTRAKIDLLEAFVGEDPRAMLMSPLPKLGNKIALTAWTHLATCTNVNEPAFKQFRDAYRGKGPERFRLDDLQPGS